MKFTIPYKEATPSRISQGFNMTTHKGLDMVAFEPVRTLGSGTPLVAPEDVRIIAIVGDGYTPNSTKAREKGFGVFMQGIESGYTHLYWHTHPYLPVNVGEIVKRGKIVAFMGNSGYVVSNGVPVPINERYGHKGTHLHWELFQSYKNNIKRGFMNPQDFIDWNLKPTYTTMDLLTCISKSLLKAAKVLK